MAGPPRWVVRVTTRPPGDYLRPSCPTVTSGRILHSMRPVRAVVAPVVRSGASTGASDRDQRALRLAERYASTDAHAAQDLASARNRRRRPCQPTFPRHRPTTAPRPGLRRRSAAGRHLRLGVRPGQRPGVSFGGTDLRRSSPTGSPAISARPWPGLRLGQRLPVAGGGPRQPGERFHASSAGAGWRAPRGRALTPTAWVDCARHPERGAGPGRRATCATRWLRPSTSPRSWPT